MRVILILAFIGFAISAVAHFSTFLGFNPQDAFPYIWLLHIGIFVVWFPAIGIQRSLPRDDKGKIKAYAFAPRWMQLLTQTAGIYMAANFAVFLFLMRAGSPSQNNGQYVLQNHGKIIRQINEQEYHQYQAYIVRGFSGHWMFFYLAAMTILASAISYRTSAEASGTSSPILGDGRTRTPLWIHTTFAVIFQMIGFFSGPAIFIAALTLFHLNFGCFTALLWLATPWPGLVTALYLLEHKFPAVCPTCGGRAYWVNSRGQKYRCGDCGWTGG